METGGGAPLNRLSHPKASVGNRRKGSWQGLGEGRGWARALHTLARVHLRRCGLSGAWRPPRWAPAVLVGGHGHCRGKSPLSPQLSRGKAVGRKGLGIPFISTSSTCPRDEENVEECQATDMHAWVEQGDEGKSGLPATLHSLPAAAPFRLPLLCTPTATVPSSGLLVLPRCGAGVLLSASPQGFWGVLFGFGWH